MDFWSKFIQFLVSLEPWAIVYPDQGGIRLRGGRYHSTLGAGFYFKIPLYDNIRVCPTNEQVVNLPNQSIRAKDGKTYALSGVIKYDVDDPKKALLSVWNWDQSLQNIAMVSVMNYMAHATNPSIPGLCDSVREELSDDGEAWGINILDFWLTDFAEHRVLRLLMADTPATVQAN